MCIIYIIVMCVNSAVHKIVTKARQLVDVKKDDGFAALHLAALNGHLRTAETLIDVVRHLFFVFTTSNYLWIVIKLCLFLWVFPKLSQAAKEKL